MPLQAERLFDVFRSRGHRRRGMYKATFETDAGQFVLAELWELCGQGRSTWNGDMQEMLVQEGKRQIFLHIVNMLEASDEELGRLARQEIAARNREVYE